MVVPIKLVDSNIVNNNAIAKHFIDWILLKRVHRALNTKMLIDNPSLLLNLDTLGVKYNISLTDTVANIKKRMEQKESDILLILNSLHESVWIVTLPEVHHNCPMFSITPTDIEIWGVNPYVWYRTPSVTDIIAQGYCRIN